MYAVRITGPDSDFWTGWVIRNAYFERGSLKMATLRRLHLAEKSATLEEAEETAVLMAAQEPHLIGRIKIMKLRKTAPDDRWAVEGSCTQ